MAVPQRLTLSPDVLFQEVSGEIVLLDLASEHYFGLDAVGARVWQLLERDGHLESMVATLLAEYAVEEGRLRTDVERLVGELLEAGLLRSAETSSVAVD